MKSRIPKQREAERYKQAAKRIREIAADFHGIPQAVEYARRLGRQRRKEKASAGTYGRQPEVPDLRQNARPARPVGLRLARLCGRAERRLPDDTPLRSLRRLRERAEADTMSYRRKSNEPGQASKCTQPSIHRQRSVQTTE